MGIPSSLSFLYLLSYMYHKQYILGKIPRLPTPNGGSAVVSVIRNGTSACVRVCARGLKRDRSSGTSLISEVVSRGRLVPVEDWEGDYRPGRARCSDSMRFVRCH